MIFRDSIQVNSWLLNWRTLAIDESCHLRDLLKPLPREAFPSSLWLEEGDDVKPNVRSPSSASAASVYTGISIRLGRLMVGNVAERAAQVSQVAQDELEKLEVSLCWERG